MDDSKNHLVTDFRALVTQRTDAAETALTAENALLAKTARIVYLIPAEVRSRLGKIFTAFLNPDKMRRKLEHLSRGESLQLEISGKDLNRLGFNDFDDAWQTLTAWQNAWKNVVNVTIARGMQPDERNDIGIRLTMPLKDGG